MIYTSSNDRHPVTKTFTLLTALQPTTCHSTSLVDTSLLPI